MSNRSIGLATELHEYVVRFGVRESDLQRRLREETARHPESQMQIAPEQGQFMALLVAMLGARRAIEIGVFTGYSSTCVGMALPSDGYLLACDVSDEYTAVARRYWAEAGIDKKIDLRLGPASITLEHVLEGGGAGTFDFAFVDADKEEYDRYYELCLQLLRPGGLIALDNMLRGGRVADPLVQDDATVAIRALNEKLHSDSRVSISLVPIADGVTLALKR